jgi:hypothetical protein
MRKDVEHRSLPDSAVAAIAVEHLLHPHNHFRHPGEVVDAPHLNKDEKRAILASWASDQFAVESMPTMRQYPGTDRAVTYQEILTALKALDREEPAGQQIPGSGEGRRFDLRSFIPLRRRPRVGSRGCDV